jgi:CRP/FNR family cyclic AMP-dependent transcriptional regulator
VSEAASQMFAKFGKRIPAGAVLFREGDVGEEMFILQSGKVKISKKIRGVEKTLATLEKGEFFGEMAILNDKPRSASAEVVEDADMLVIDRKTFEMLLRSNVEIAIRFIKRLADRLRETNEQMEALMIRDSTSRLLNILAKRVRENKGANVALAIDDLASLAGLESIQARQILEKLSNVRILTLTPDEHVTITSQEQMQRLLRYLEMREIFGEIV